MRWSVGTSLALHAAILAAALVVLPNPEAHKVKPVEAIQVDITNISDTSKRMAMTKEAEAKTEQPAPKKTETVKKTDPKAKVAEEVKKVANEPKAEPPPPEPKKEEPKKKEVVKKEEPPPDPADMAALLKKTVEEEKPKKEEPKQETKKAEAKPKDKPKKPDKKAEKKKPAKLDVDQMEAFLNKIDDESTAPIETSQLDGAPAQGEANLQGTDSQLSATMIEALVQRIRQCWVVPPGAREAQIVVKVRFALNPDGSVVGLPEVRNGSGDPLFEATARSAVAAVMDCQVYDFLPQDQYDAWKDIIINFNPNMMFDS